MSPSLLSLKQGSGRRSPANKKSPSRSRFRYVPGFDVLEDRSVPAFFTVNNFGDAGAGIGNSGDLRYVITQANSQDGPHTINIFINANQTISLNSELPALNADISIGVIASIEVIAGQPPPPTPTLTIQRSTAEGTAKFRIFEINQGKTVNISGPKITNGWADSPTADSGGGIWNKGTLNLYGVEIYGNKALRNGGGIRNQGTLTVENSRIYTNTAGAAWYGGGIFNSGQAWVQSDSEVFDNYAGFGGGIANNPNASFTVTNSYVRNNRAEIGGGGVYNMSTFQMQGGRLRENSVLNAAGKGGGIYNENGTATFNDVQIASNMAYKGGGIYAWLGDVDLFDCTLRNNVADEVPGACFRQNFGFIHVTGGTIEQTIDPDPNP